MAQYKIWYALQLKAWLKRKTSWLQVLGMILLVLLTAHIHLPDADNTRVGVCGAEDEYADSVLESLRSGDSIFEFVEYPEEEDMRRDMVSGRIECGFLFPEDFQERIWEDRLKNSVTYICTPFSAKGLVAQETFYAAFFEGYSKKILIGSEEEMYGRSSEKLTEALLEKRDDYLYDREMFCMDIIETAQPRGEAGASGEVRPVQGMTGLFLFAILWMAQGRKFDGNGNGALSALDWRRRRRFRYLGCLAEATVPAAAGILLILSAPGHRGIGAEISSMVLFVLVCSFWVPTVGSLFHNSTSFAGWTLTILLVQMAVCPAFVDLAEYVPALKVIRWGFPLGWLG
ncbi:hypothetical protein D3Z62_22900 [Lachnospiraceae bacterium]|nr:hypothetical protein [Lachnospiraceae bacterium]